MSTPAISVAIASYNGARHIGAQLDSIAAQTRLPDELIVADDGSSDDTLAIVEAFGARVPFAVRIVRHPRNLGILENFYSAFAACTGAVIFYCDQDDVWAPDKVARMMTAFDDPDIMLAVHQSEVVEADLTPTGVIAPGNRLFGALPFPADVRAIRSFGHQMAFRRTLLPLVAAMRPIVDELPVRVLVNNLDGLLPFCASLAGGIVAFEERFTRFRRHASATSGAGLAPGAVPSWRARTAELIAQDVEQTAGYLAAIEAGIAAGAIAPGRGERLITAYRRRLALARRQQAIASGSRVARLARAPGAMIAAARGSGFSKERRLQSAKLALAAALA